MFFVTYDPGKPFPQDASFGRGVTQGDQHIEAPGMASYSVHLSALTQGIDERFYHTIAGPTLQAKTRADINAIKLQGTAEKLKAYRVTVAQIKIDALDPTDYSGVFETRLTNMLAYLSSAVLNLRAETKRRATAQQTQALDNLGTIAASIVDVLTARTDIEAKIPGTCATTADGQDDL